MGWTNLRLIGPFDACILPGNDDEHDNLPNSAETRKDNHSKPNTEITSNEPTNREIKDNIIKISLDESDPEKSDLYAKFNVHDLDRFCNAKKLKLIDGDNIMFIMKLLILVRYVLLRDEFVSGKTKNDKIQPKARYVVKVF